VNEFQKDRLRNGAGGISDIEGKARRVGAVSVGSKQVSIEFLASLQVAFFPDIEICRNA